jgi:hypothetical protein
MVVFPYPVSIAGNAGCRRQPKSTIRGKFKIADGVIPKVAVECVVILPRILKDIVAK